MKSADDIGVHIVATNNPKHFSIMGDKPNFKETIATKVSENSPPIKTQKPIELSEDNFMLMVLMNQNVKQYND
ncbi:MAG: hypothetical protein QM632_00770 [Micrococcaceae bacterium]